MASFSINGATGRDRDPSVSASPSSSSMGRGQNQQDQGRRQKLKELLRPVFQESYFSAEYCLLAAVQCNQPSKLSGLYVVPSAQSPFLWLAVLFVHSGPWQGGVFRFTMTFPDNFPDASIQNNVPAVQFTGAYPKCHPLINPSRGNFDIRRFYKSYNRSNHHIWQLVKCIRKVFYKFEIQDKIVYPNKTAAELYLKSQEQFLAKCKIDADTSVAKRFEEDVHSKDANYIRFSRDFGKIESLSESAHSSGIGLSWMSSMS